MATSSPRALCALPFSVTTGTNGAALPPVPWKVAAISLFASQPSLPGTENFCCSALVAAPDVAPPTSVKTIQKPITRRLWRRTQSVTVEIMNDLYHKRFVSQVKILFVLYSDRPPEELAGYTGFLLGYLGEKSRRRFFQTLEPHGFEPREFGVMTVLKNRPGLTQHELASLARIDPSSMVAVLDALEVRGVVERRIDA